MGKKERRLRVPKVPALEVLSYQVKEGTRALVRRHRSEPWRDYVTARTQWYAADEACTAGVGQLLIRRGEWELLLDLALVTTLLGSKQQTILRPSGGLTLEQKVLSAVKRKPPRNALPWADVENIFGYALNPDR